MASTEELTLPKQGSANGSLFGRQGSDRTVTLTKNPSHQYFKLQEGISSPLTKIRKSKTYRRRYVIPDDCTCIKWDSNKKRDTSSKILISRITELIVGQSSSVFQSALRDDKSLEKHALLSFTLVYTIPADPLTGSPQHSETLDLFADNEADYNMWVSTLGKLIEDTKSLLDFMKKGSTMTKCRPKDQYKRRYFLTDDLKLRWEPSKKDGHLDLGMVKFLRLGQKTLAFRRSKNIGQFEKLSFSLVYKSSAFDDDEDGFSTLDLIAQNEKDYERWVVGLNTLISGAKDSQAMMQRGSNMIKVYSGSRTRERTYYLSADMQYIEWQPRTNPLNRIKIDNVKEMRFGQNTDTWKGRTQDFDPKLCFSIIYGANYKTLDLVCRTPEDYDDWTTGLEDLLYSKLEVQRSAHVFTVEELRTAFKKMASQRGVVDRHGEPSLRFGHAVKLLSSIEPSFASTPNVARLRKLMEGGEATTVSFDLLVDMYHEISSRPEIGTIMRAISSLKGRAGLSRLCITAVELQKFLIDVQKIPAEKATIEYVDALIMEHEPFTDNKEHEVGAKLLSREGLLSILLSSHGDAFNPEHEEIYQDMDQPLCNYFINSSHNTFLTADQLRGRSSEEAYIRALQRGCRCIEIDAWDGDNGEPVVYHGHTLTSKITFRSTIMAVNKYAFAASPYPLIISIENHCGLSQQRLMAKYMVDIFGSKLVERPSGPISQLPSPEKLKHKILIKCKTPIGYSFKKVIVAVGEDGQEYDGLSSSSLARQQVQDVGKPVIKVAKELADLIVYTATIPGFEGWLGAERKQECWMMNSWGELAGIDICKNPASALQFVRYNSNFFSRLYPAGSRVDSSNFNPQIFWNHGCQMVALNFQTDGPPMQINDGKFRQNGRCGYVLKPQFLRDPESNFIPSHEVAGHVDGCQPCVLTIRLISAQQLPRARIVTPQVSIEVVGTPGDTLASRSRTLFGEEALTPYWNESFSFPVTVPDLALVRFVVRDYRGKFTTPGFVAESTIPLLSLCQGFRHVRLFNSTGDPLSATLFVDITIQEDFARGLEWWGQLSKTVSRGVDGDLIKTDTLLEKQTFRARTYGPKIRPVRGRPARLPRLPKALASRYYELCPHFEHILKESELVRQKMFVLRDRNEISELTSLGFKNTSGFHSNINLGGGKGIGSGRGSEVPKYLSNTHFQSSGSKFLISRGNVALETKTRALMDRVSIMLEDCLTLLDDFYVIQNDPSYIAVVEQTEQKADALHMSYSFNLALLTTTIAALNHARAVGAGILSKTRRSTEFLSAAFAANLVPRDVIPPPESPVPKRGSDGSIDMGPVSEIRGKSMRASRKASTHSLRTEDQVINTSALRGMHMGGTPASSSRPPLQRGDSTEYGFHMPDMVPDSEPSLNDSPPRPFPEYTISDPNEEPIMMDGEVLEEKLEKADRVRELRPSTSKPLLRLGSTRQDSITE